MSCGCNGAAASSGCILVGGYGLFEVGWCTAAVVGY